MSTCLGHPLPAEGRKALQVREPSEGAPSSTTQGLHGLHKVKRYHMNRLTIHKTLQRALGSKKAPETNSPWASSLVKARLTKDSEWGDPRVMESSRGPAPFKKDNLPRQKGRGTSTYVVRGCCLL